MIHKTAIIDKSAIIEDNVTVGPYTVIGEGVKIKSGTVIGSNAFIEYAEIGNNCKVFNSASVGSAPQDLKYVGEKTKVVIGDNTTVREYVTLNRGTAAKGETVIGSNCLFMVSAHVGHDSIIGDNVIIGNCTAIGGHVEIGNNAFISALVAVHQFCRIGKGTMTAGGSVVTMDTIPHSMCHGDRAVLSGLNLVGMKRRNMSKQDIEDVKHAYRILFMSKLLLKDALEELDKSSSAEVKEIAEFIRTSQRGIVRPN